MGGLIFLFISRTQSKMVIDWCHRRFLEANRAWIDQLFRNCTNVEAVLRVPHENSGHRYVFRHVVLNTRLGRVATFDTSGDKCGDNGGRTAKDAPCKRNAISHGRCALHPPDLFRVTHEAGAHVPELILDFGNDGALRPVPAALTWDAALVSVAGESGLSVVDHRGRALLLVSATRVLDEIILAIKQTMRCEPEAHVVLVDSNGSHHRLAVDPLWTVAHFRQVYRLGLEPLCCKTLDCRLDHGYLLMDYGVGPGTVSMFCVLGR